MAIFGLFGIDTATISAIARAVVALQQPQLNRIELAIQKQGVKLMDITTQLAQAKADLDAIKADQQITKTGILALQTQVSSLTQQLATALANAGLTADQQAAFADVVAEADAAKATADDLAASVTPPAPDPTPAG